MERNEKIVYQFRAAYDIYNDGCEGGGGTKLRVPNFLSRAYCYEP